MVRGLSGGEKRRLSIACGVVAQPAIIFADEPTSGVSASMELMLHGPCFQCKEAHKSLSPRPEWLLRGRSSVSEERGRNVGWPFACRIKRIQVYGRHVCVHHELTSATFPLCT